MSDEERTPAEMPADGEKASMEPTDTGVSARVSRLTAAPPIGGESARTEETSAQSSGVRAEGARLRAEGEKLLRETLSSEKAKRRDIPRSYSTFNLTQDEKLWAAAAHVSVWFTVLGGAFTGGTVVPLSVFIPLIIYFIFRRRSDFVAFHALQAFTLQVIGTVGALLLFVVGGVVWTIGMIVALLLVLLLVGFVLVPLWGLVGLIMLLITALMPVAMLLFGTIAAFETYNGRDYRYPFVGRWVDRQLAGDFLQP